jgi:putative redox protein
MSIALQRKSGEALSQTVRIRQHLLLSDVSVLEGGTDEGPSPHDLYDAALGSCKALTVLWYARKKGIPVKDIQTEVISDNSEERKGTYRLNARLKISGDLTDAQLAELTSVAEKCPVHKLMTTVTTEITTSVERVV